MISQFNIFEKQYNRKAGGILHNMLSVFYKQFSQKFIIYSKLTDILGFNLLK